VALQDSPFVHLDVPSYDLILMLGVIAQIMRMITQIDNKSPLDGLDSIPQARTPGWDFYHSGSFRAQTTSLPCCSRISDIEGSILI
jgi:hypothetical protein